jgi:hypothetical protein
VRYPEKIKDRKHFETEPWEKVKHLMAKEESMAV